MHRPEIHRKERQEQQQKYNIYMYDNNSRASNKKHKTIVKK